jgi:hypothetical protein
MIERHGWKTGREGAIKASALQLAPDIAKNSAKESDRVRSGQAVEVAEQDQRFLRPELLSEEIGLTEPLRSAEREMGINDPNLAQVCFRVCPNGYPGLATIPVSFTREFDDTAVHQRETADDGVAIFFAAITDRGMKDVVPSELMRNYRCLVHALGASAVDVEFLQADKVDLHARDNFCHPRFRALPIHTDTAMHVVSGNT